jgi:hypothetical protein
LASLTLGAWPDQDEGEGPLELRADHDLEGVAARRQRFLTHAAAARQVATYEFMIPAGATTTALRGDGELRDARAQALLIVSMVGGAVGKAWGGLRIRIPVAAVGRFEGLAKALIEDFMVAFDRPG